MLTDSRIVLRDKCRMAKQGLWRKKKPHNKPDKLRDRK